MARRRKRGKSILRAVEVGLGVGILAGVLARYGVGLPIQRSLRAALLAGAVTSAFWLVRPLLDWLWQKSAWWRRHGQRQWARHLVGVELAVGSALLVGIIARYALALTARISVQAGAAVGLAVLGLWLLRPFFAWLWLRARQVGQGTGTSLREQTPRNAARTGAARPSDLQKLTPAEFEELCAAIARAWGYEARAVGESGDGGVDVQMWRDGEYVVGQCKRYKGTVPISHVRDFYGAMMHVGAARGYFFTTSRFSDGAYEFVKGKPLELLDGPYLQNVISRLDIAS